MRIFWLALLVALVSPQLAVSCQDFSGHYVGDDGGRLEIEQTGCTFVRFSEKPSGKIYSADLMPSLHLGPLPAGDDNVGAVILYSGWNHCMIEMHVISLDKNDVFLGRQIRRVAVANGTLTVVTFWRDARNEAREETRRFTPQPDAPDLAAMRERLRGFEKPDCRQPTSPKKSCPKVQGIYEGDVKGEFLIIYQDGCETLRVMEQRRTANGVDWTAIGRKHILDGNDAVLPLPFTMDGILTPLIGGTNANARTTVTWGEFVTEDQAYIQLIGVTDGKQRRREELWLSPEAAGLHMTGATVDTEGKSTMRSAKWKKVAEPPKSAAATE